MNWSEKEYEESARRAAAVVGVRAQIKVFMDYAAELLAARGGTMTAEQLAERIGRIRRSFASFGTEFAGILSLALHEVEQHIAAQGAKVAALEAERDKWQGVAQSRLAHERQLQGQLEALRAELARLKPSGQVAICPRCGRRFPGCAAPHGGEECDVPLSPSGQVAEDNAALRDIINEFPGISDEQRATAHAARSRLAALAQQGQDLLNKEKQS